MVGVYRISALPNEIKVSILSCLSTTDAIRTSVLSRSWCHVWTFLPGFHAYLNSYRHPTGPTESFRRILSSFRGPILHVSLRCFLNKSERSCLQHFFELIFQKGGLRILSVNCMRGLALVQLPSFCSLKDLHLERIIITFSSDFDGFE